MRTRSAMAAVALAAVFAAAVMWPGTAADRSVTIFAAASLGDAVSEFAERFEAQNGVPVRVSVAASSTLARQIEAGARADIYLSASEEWMDYLLERRRVDLESVRTPLTNRLVVVAIGEAPVAPADLANALLPGQRLAMGDPAHVPAGIYARNAFEQLGNWTALSSRVAYADSVRAALTLVARGEAAFGVVYATDVAVAPALHVVGAFDPAHTGLVRYQFALVGESPGERARAAYAALLGELGSAAFARAGFTVTAAEG